MSLLRLLLGRRKFLVGCASAALTVAFGRISGIFGLISQTNPARALDNLQPIVNKKLKGIVVYYSATGNTAQIAKAIHRGMKSVIPCDVVQITKLDPKKMTRYDLVALGSPNWSMRTPAVLSTFTNDMPRMDGKHCVLFGTHGTRPIGQFWFSSRNLLKKGMTVIGWGDWYGAALGERTPHLAWGHPDSVDLAEAEAFGKRMAESSVRIYAGDTELIPELPKPDVREGSAENVWTPLVRHGHITFANPPPDSIPQFDLSKCVYPRCTQCEDICPAHAIDLSVMARTGAVTPADTVVTQDTMAALSWGVHPTIGQDYSLVVKQACQHCGGVCQRVCKYDAIAYLGEQKPVTINPKKCAYPKCTICSDLCAQSAIDLTKSPPVIHNYCDPCGLCAGACPYNAVEDLTTHFNPFLDGWWNKNFDPARQFSGGMMQRELLANPRFRNLVRKVDMDNPIDLEKVTGIPRVPIKKDLWPYDVDENS